MTWGRSAPCYSQNETTVRFTGKERDPETGFDYFGVRYYLPAMGRFLGADPENAGADAENPQSWNGYSYAFNTPKVAVDPDGLATECTTTAATFCVTATSPSPYDPFRDLGIDLQLAWASYQSLQNTIWQTEQQLARHAVNAITDFTHGNNCTGTLVSVGQSIGASAVGSYSAQAGFAGGVAAGAATSPVPLQRASAERPWQEVLAQGLVTRPAVGSAAQLLVSFVAGVRARAAAETVLRTSNSLMTRLEKFTALYRNLFQRD